MGWRTIGATETDPSKPGTSELFKALADNPAAMANGEAGAPRVKDAALDTGVATTAGRDWVLARTALASIGAVGTYALLLHQTSDSLSEGELVAGSSLSYTGLSFDETGAGVGSISSGTSPAGTWQAMGRVNSINATNAATLFLRVS